MEPLLKWEKINDNGLEWRTKVKGGWIVKINEEVMHNQDVYGRGMVTGYDWRISICFVPDPNHTWAEKWRNEEISTGDKVERKIKDGCYIVHSPND